MSKPLIMVSTFFLGSIVLTYRKYFPDILNFFFTCSSSPSADCSGLSVPARYVHAILDDSIPKMSIISYFVASDMARILSALLHEFFTKAFCIIVLYRLPIFLILNCAKSQIVRTYLTLPGLPHGRTCCVPQNTSMSYFFMRELPLIASHSVPTGKSSVTTCQLLPNSKSTYTSLLEKRKYSLSLSVSFRYFTILYT